MNLVLHLNKKITSQLRETDTILKIVQRRAEGKEPLLEPEWKQEQDKITRRGARRKS